MMTSRPSFWLPVTAVTLVVAGLLGWLLIAFAGQRDGCGTIPGEIEYLIDPTPAAAEPPFGRVWSAWPEKGSISAFEGKSVWIRLSLRNPGDRALHGVLENDDFFTDRVEARIGNDAGSALHLWSGEMMPASGKALVGREIAFPVTVPPHSEQSILLRFDDHRSVYAKPVWWPEADDFYLARTRSGLAEGIYFGALLALLGYNALLWIRLRQRDIGLYVLYLGAGAGFMVLARAQIPALGWPLGSPWLEALLTTAMALSACMLTAFARVYMDTREQFPAVDRFLKGWSMSLGVLAVASLLLPKSVVTPPMWLAVVAIGVTHAVLMVLVAAAWRAGLWQARLFALSFGFLFAGSLPLVWLWFSETSLRDLGMRGLMIGSALEMLTLSLTIADRYARTQRRLVEETEQLRTMEEAYSDELEEEVRQRTLELQSANIDKDRMLFVIGHDLRGPLTGLMRSADQASPQLPRDVSQTCRALLLMIEDLLLWPRIRAGRRMTSVHPVSSLVVPALALHHALAEQDGVELRLEVSGEILIETDLVLAQTLVRNLLANALKSARRTVLIRTEAEGDRLRFIVGNDGPPLPPAIAARLSSGQDEPVTATGGMGLKLCREICDALGTPLQSRSPQDGGAEFDFTLTLAPAPVSQLS